MPSTDSVLKKVSIRAGDTPRSMTVRIGELEADVMGRVSVHYDEDDNSICIDTSKGQKCFPLEEAFPKWGNLEDADLDEVARTIQATVNGEAKEERPLTPYEASFEEFKRGRLAHLQVVTLPTRARDLKDILILKDVVGLFPEGSVMFAQARHPDSFDEITLAVDNGPNGVHLVLVSVNGTRGPFPPFTVYINTEEQENPRYAPAPIEINPRFFDLLDKPANAQAKAFRSACKKKKPSWRKLKDWEQSPEHFGATYSPEEGFQHPASRGR